MEHSLKKRGIPTGVTVMGYPHLLKILYDPLRRKLMLIILSSIYVLITAIIFSECITIEKMDLKGLSCSCLWSNPTFQKLD